MIPATGFRTWCGLHHDVVMTIPMKLFYLKRKKRLRLHVAFVKSGLWLKISMLGLKFSLFTWEQERVEPKGIEPSTSRLPASRSPN